MPRFATGTTIRVRDLGKAGHVRIPHYIRHRTGRVIQFCGAFLNPEDLATGNASGPVVECYRVEFSMPDVWDDYDGAASDMLVIEIYAHWMEATPSPGGGHDG